MQISMDLVFDRVPVELKDHLFAYGVPPSLFLPPWLLTVFSADFPVAFAARLIDIILVEGWQRILISTSVGLLTVAKESLLEARSMEEVMDVLKVRHRCCTACGQNLDTAVW
jgi:Rab-GTPase-TBC domain